LPRGLGGCRGLAMSPPGNARRRTELHGKEEVLTKRCRKLLGVTQVFRMGSALDWMSYGISEESAMVVAAAAC
jgi:hypothetical protein